MKGAPTTNQHRRNLFALALLSSAFLATFFLFSFSTLITAEPSGASITYNSTDNGPTIQPSSHTANRSTITTLILDVLQQDQHWKAYIGNVTGTFTLDDANNYTIYSWPSSATITGEVIVSRATLDFSTVSCAAAGTIASEETFHNMTAAESDSISSTFNWTGHTTTTIASTALSGCNATTLYVNDASQGQTSAADFQEFLMEDNGGNLAYVAIINDNTAGYNNQNYDFQAIVAESDVKTSPTTYYFYVELG
ncbi:hypothetical protein D6783_05835 [Candidatus Woesearchaeota archaeon]|nr:MAG: hypothetical protein D6783_05835 [Candidatus Woesearchaeota archaeon]